MTTSELTMKLLRVKFLLANGIHSEDHSFKIENHQPDFERVKVGQFALLSSNLETNLTAFGKIVGVICNSTQIKQIHKKNRTIPRAMLVFDLSNEQILDLLEGMEEIL